MDSSARLHLNLTRTESMKKSASVPKHNYTVPVPVSINKLKASNVPATALIVGDWKWHSWNTEDLMAKIYYARRRLVWEVLKGALKWKMEIKWSDIVAIKAHLQEQGILEIQLNQPPSFFREIDTQPRKHTKWEPSPDFTGGHAITWRIHCLVFPPKTLDKHYIQLLKSDERLLALSQCPIFPSQQYSPYFNPIHVSQDLNGQAAAGTIFPPAAEALQHLTYPTIIPPETDQLPQNSMVSPVINHEHRTIWNEAAAGTNYFSDQGNGNMQAGPPYVSSTVTPHQPYEVSFNNIPQNDDSTLEQMDLKRDDISHVASDHMQSACDDISHVASYDHMQSACDAISHLASYDHMQSVCDDSDSLEMEHWKAIIGMTRQECVEWLMTPNSSPTHDSDVDAYLNF